jgi:hypothetical protein
MSQSSDISLADVTGIHWNDKHTEEVLGNTESILAMVAKTG